MRCTECGSQQAKWSGKCPQCGAWGSLEEESATEARSTARSKKIAPARIEKLGGSAVSTTRYSTSLAEVDRALGGGIVRGSVLLMSGAPGIGKSTLLLQIASGLVRSGLRTVYVSGEETAAQIHDRAQRIGVSEALDFASETDAGAIGALMASDRPDIVIVDSVQTLTLEGLPGSPGSVQQVRSATELLRTVGKQHGVTVILVGHVTKDGLIAGPKTLEHMVDVVCTIEGDRTGLRLIRCTKNRFGPAHEIGVLEMRGTGLADVQDPSRFFLEHRDAPVAGVALGAAMDEQRLFVVEVQALVRPSSLAMPRRVVSGLESRRVELVLAVLERHAGIRVGNADLFLALAGGASFQDPGLDLAVAAAIASSASGAVLPPGMVLAGEVSLTGEVRAPALSGKRRDALRALGFEQVVLPSERERPSLRDVLRSILPATRPRPGSRPEAPQDPRRSSDPQD